MFGDGANASEVRRLWNVFMFACSDSDVKSTGSSSADETPLLTLDDFCQIPELEYHPFRKRLFSVACRFPPSLDGSSAMSFVQFVRLFHILSPDGRMMSKTRLVFDIITEFNHRSITRDHLRDFISMVSECEDEDVDYVVEQVFIEIAEGDDEISFAAFRDLVSLTDSFVSTVCIQLQPNPSRQKKTSAADLAPHGSHIENAIGNTNTIDDLEFGLEHIKEEETNEDNPIHRDMSQPMGEVRDGEAAAENRNSYPEPHDAGTMAI